MKFISLGTAIGFTCWALSSLALSAEKPRTVVSPVDKVFVPNGFDDNDDTEVIVHGHFPSTCYKVGPTTAKINESSKTVVISALAYYYDDATCAQVSVPFIQSVKLGALNGGDYQIVVTDRPSADVKGLHIARSTHDGPDDYLYAPVSDVRLSLNGQAQLTIEGTYPSMFSGCMVVKSVKTETIPGNLLVVQPIAEILQGESCRGIQAKFSISTDLSDRYEPGEYLVHVRVLTGESLNKLISIGR